MNEFVAFPSYWNQENVDIWINKYLIDSRDSREDLDIDYNREADRYQFDVQYLRNLYINNRMKFNYINKVMPLYGIYVSVNKGAGIFGDSKIKNGLHYLSSYNAEASLSNISDNNIKTLINFLNIQTTDELLGLIVERVIDLMPIINLEEIKKDLDDSGFYLSEYNDEKELVKLHTDYQVMACVSSENVEDDDLVQKHLDYDLEDKQLLIPLIFHDKNFIRFALNRGKLMETKSGLENLINGAFLNGKINLNVKSQLDKRISIVEDIFSESISIGYDLKVIKKAILYEIKNYFTDIDTKVLIKMLNKVNTKSLLFNLMYFWDHSSFEIKAQLNDLYNHLDANEKFVFNNVDKIALPIMINKTGLNASKILTMQSDIHHKIISWIYDKHILLNVFIASQVEHKDFADYFGENSDYILNNVIDDDNNIQKYWNYQDDMEVDDYKEIDSKQLEPASFHIDIKKAKDAVGESVLKFIEDKLSHQLAFPESDLENYIDELMLNNYLSKKDSRLLYESNINSNVNNLEVFLSHLNPNVKVYDHLIMPIECNFTLFSYLLDNVNEKSTEQGVREFFNKYLKLKDVSKVLNNPKLAKVNGFRYISARYLNLDDDCLFQIEKVLEDIMTNDYVVINDELISNLSLPDVDYGWTPELLVSYAQLLGYRKLMWPRKITHFEPNLIGVSTFDGDMIDITVNKVKDLMNQGNNKVINVYDSLVDMGILRPQSSNSNKKIPEVVLKRANLVSDNGTLIKD